MNSEPVTISCSLEMSDIQSRQQEWEDLLRRTLVARQPIQGGISLRLNRSPGAEAQLKRLISLEQQCCAWIDWSVRSEDLIEVQATTSEEQGVRLLRDWFRVVAN